MDKIDKFVINLKDKPERLLSTLNVLRNIDMIENIIRVEAVSPSEAKKKQFNILSKRSFKNLFNNEKLPIIHNYQCIGCALSHMKIWTTIINKNIKGAFIIEDDIEIQNYDMFKIEKKHILEIIKNKSGPLFMTINSKQIYHKPFVKFNTCTVNFSKDVEKIMDPFLGLHFYYVNKEMCEFLIENISMISYQIDIEIGLLSKVNKYRPLYFLNYKTDILTQNNKFMSDIQPFYYSPTSLSIILKIPVDISTTIYHYIPAIFKLKREDLKYENVSRERINSIISY